MDFARFNFYHQHKVYNKPVDGLFYLPDLDSVPLDFVPVSFHHLLETSYHFTDPYIAQSIVPDHFDQDRHTNSLRMYLAAAGFIFKEIGFNFDSHFHFAERLTNGKLKNSDIDKLNVDGLSVDTFSFASKNIKKIIKLVDSKIKEGNGESSLILIFFTPVGIALYHPPKSSFDNIEIGVVVSKTEILQIKLDQQQQIINLNVMSKSRVQPTNPPPPRTFCEFAIIQGTWQPILKTDQLAAISIDLSSGVTSSRDNCTVDFSHFAGFTSRVIGLIGRFSDIIKLFSSKMKDTLNNIRINLNPYMFFIKPTPEQSVTYLILYLPSNFMPDHPQFIDVVQYAYTFMRRACTLTLLVPNVESMPPTNHINNHIQGVLKQANAAETFFFGSEKSQILCLRTRPFVQSMEFDDFKDFTNWLNWISPSYSFDFSALQFVSNDQGISFDYNTVINLIKNDEQKKKRHFIDSIIYGYYGKGTPSDLAEKMIEDNSISPNISLLIDKAVNVSKEAANCRMKKDICVVCQNLDDLSEESQIILINETEDNKLCEICIEKKSKAKTGVLKNYKDNTKIFQNSIKDLNTFYVRNVTLEQNKVNNFFIDWFFEFYAKYNLEANWEKLKLGNYLKYSHFDEVNTTMKEDGTIEINGTFKSAVEKLSQTHFESNSDKYKSELVRISQYYGHLLDHEFLFNNFKEALVARNEKYIETRDTYNIDAFFRLCDERTPLININEKNDKSGKKTIKFKSIIATNRMTLTVTLDDELNTVDFKHYTFHHVNVSTNENFSAEPLQGERTAELVQQPCHMNIVNAWRVPKGVLVLTAIGNKMRLIFLPANFEGRFVDKYIYETDIADANFCHAAFAPVTNVMCIVTKVNTEQNDVRRVIILLQVSLDLSSSVEVRRRPLECLLPLPINSAPIFDDNEISKKKEKAICEPIFDGFTIDDTATHGVLGASNKKSKNEPDEHILIEFNPTTLSMQRIHNVLIDCPIYPLHFLTTEKPFDTIVGVSPFAQDHNHHILIFTETKPQGAKIKLNGLGDLIINRIGVSNYNDQNILVFAHDNQPPTLQQAIHELPSFPVVDDPFIVDFGFKEIPQFIAGCINKYGFSEIERVFFPTGLPYPVELTKFEVLNCQMDDNNNFRFDNLFEMINESLSDVLPFDWSVPFRVHKCPPDKNLTKLFGTKNCYYASINFVARLMSLPHVFVPSISRVPRNCSKYISSSIKTAATKIMSHFPPLPLLRATMDRDAVVVSMVDIGSSDGSGLLSAVTGVPFTPSLPGTLRIGCNYVPLFDAESNDPYFENDGYTIRSKSVNNFLNVLAVSLKSDSPEIIASNVVSIYCAMGCSDLVIINAGNQTQLLIDVMKLLIEVFDDLDTIHGKLFFSSDNQQVAVAKRMVFVTDLGPSPDAKIAEIGQKISFVLSQSPSEFTQEVFKKKKIIVPSDLSLFEIARSIANSQLLPLAKKKGFRKTSEAYKQAHSAAGMFGSLLSHLELFMVIGEGNEEDDTEVEEEEDCEVEEEEENEEDKED